MGAASTILADGSIPGDLKLLMEVIERQKDKISDNDAAVIEKEMKKMFKGHQHIIEQLTSRTKDQIRRLFERHPESVKHLDELVEAGNLYAKFITLLAKSKQDLEMDAIKESKHKDYDEDLMINIIGTSTIDEIRQLDDLFVKERNYTINDLFLANAKKNTDFYRFMQRILKLDRDESKTSDHTLAVHQAQVIHKAGAAKLIGVDEEIIFDILCTASRAQCQAIHEAYLEQHNMKLERAINMKFKGNCAKVMLLWTQNVQQSIVTACHYLCQKMLVDKHELMMILAKYDKDMLSQADESAKKYFKKSFGEVLNQGTSGTLHKALQHWIESPSPDKGYEKILQLYIQSKLQKDMTIADIFSNQETLAKICFVAEKQAQELKLYMIDKKIKLESSDQAILARSFAMKRKPSNNSSLHLPNQSSSNMNINSASMSDLHKPNTHNNSYLTLKSVSSDNLNSPRDSISTPTITNPHASNLFYHHALDDTVINPQQNDEKSKAAYQYLIDYFEQFDTSGEGSFPADQFWQLCHKLPLHLLGLTAEDLDSIRDWCDWESDGLVFYYETLFEFSDSVVKAIEKHQQEKNLKDGDVFSVLKECRELLDQEQLNVISSLKVSKPGEQLSLTTRIDLTEASLRKASLCVYPHIPMVFREYLVITCAAFDFDCNGFLTQKELTSLLEVLNISFLTIKHFLVDESMKSVTAKEAADVICKHIDIWFTDNQEHYICLVDNASGAYYWYNTLDGSTQWADTSSNEATGAAEQIQQEEAVQSESSKNQDAAESKQATESKSVKEEKTSSEKIAESKSTKEETSEKKQDTKESAKDDKQNTDEDIVSSKNGFIENSDELKETK